MQFLTPYNTLAYLKYLLIIFAIAISMPAVSADLAGHVILAKGQVTAVNENGESRKLKRRSKIFNGDVIKTGSNGSVQLRFIDKALMTIKANSEMDIASYQQGGNGEKEEAIMNLVKGGFRTITGQIGKGDKSAYKVSTPAASIGIRGTNYEVQQESDGGFVMAVYSGGISVQNDSGTLELGLGSDFNFVRVSSDSAPVGLLSAPESLTENAATESSEDEESSDDSADEKADDSSGDESASSDEDGDDKDSEKSTVAANDSSGGDDSSVGESEEGEAESPIAEAISAVQAELEELDEGTEDVLKEVVAALDRTLEDDIETKRDIVKEEVTQELIDGGFLEEGQTLADLEDTVKENLQNLGSLDDLKDAIDSGTDLTQEDAVPDPDSNPNTEPDPDPTPVLDPLGPAEFIQHLYTDLTPVNNPFPTNVVTNNEFNLVDSNKLAVLAMPLDYVMSADGNPEFSFHEAQLQSPNAINLSSFTGFDYSATGNQADFGIRYEITNIDTGQTQEFEIPVHLDQNIVTIGDLEAFLSNAITNGDVFVPGSQTPITNPGHINVFQADPGGQGTEAQFVFQPNSGSNTFITKMELHFADESSASGQALITQLSGTNMIGEEDWRAQTDTEMVIASGAWKIADADGSGSPILYFQDTRTENVNGVDMEVPVEEIINKPLSVDTVSSLLGFASCGSSDPTRICDIAVEAVKASDRIRWGAWLAEPGEGISITELGVDGFTDTHTDEQVLAFWLAAERADISQLTGTAQFSSTTHTSCTDYSQCLGFADDGIVQSVTGQFNVNFDTGSITNGNLNVNVTDDPNLNLIGGGLGPTTSEWDVNFSGQLSTGTNGNRRPEFVTNSINGVVKDGAGNQISDKVVGNIGGVFVTPGDVFAGGYNLGTVDGTNKQTSGVFTLEEVNP